MSSIGLLGKKLGMTRVYDDAGNAVTVTVIDAAGNRVLAVRDSEKDGYTAIQVGYADQKPQRVSKAQLGHFGKTDSTPKRFIREFRLKDGESAPDSVDLPVTTFEVGQFVDVIGQSKGKGFAGPMKRHNFSGQPASHGHTMHRRTGSIGAGSTPGLVRKNTKMPGHMGDDRVTTQNLKVVQVREEDGLILISGAVPGANGSYVTIRPSIKKTKVKQD